MKISRWSADTLQLEVDATGCSDHPHRFHLSPAGSSWMGAAGSTPDFGAYGYATVRTEGDKLRLHLEHNVKPGLRGGGCAAVFDGLL